MAYRSIEIDGERMNKIKKTVLHTVCLILCFSTFFLVCIGFDFSVLAQAAPAADAAASIIRVKLSVGDCTEISVTLNGTYSTETGPLPAGSYRVKNTDNTLSIIDSTGVTLYTSPTSLMIQENQNPDPSATNLITLKAGGNNRNYFGSMKFWIDGVYVDVVNHVYLEKYLYGVVAYEMSNSFPLEALKAQSVAARGFAYKHLEGSRSAIYDIGDTSNDQVYKGFDPTLANAKVRQAVDTTAGQVLTYNDSIITAYYAASNGGQTDRAENVWSAAMPYLKIRLDPYDLANPSSMQKTVYFPIGSLEDKLADMPPQDLGAPTLTEEELALLAAAKQDIRYTQDDLDSRLLDFLQTKAIAMLEEKNAALSSGQKYLTSPETIKIKAIVNMSAVQTNSHPYCHHHADSTDDPPHDASNCPSIDFTGAKMTVLLKVTQENAGKAGGYDRLDLTWDYQFTIPSYLKSSQYPQWQIFGTTDLRIYAVETGADLGGRAAFKLINRRFGHGVGLSQRGAQQRAKDTDPQISQYQNILAFYYPNTTLMDTGLTEPVAPPLMPKTSEVTFKDWDGTTLKTETVPLGESATAPTDPVREGYAFTGWDTAFAEITADLTVTAQYTIGTVAVTFDSQGGSAVPVGIPDSNGLIIAPENPVRNGFVFAGWYSSSSLTTPWNFTVDQVTGNCILYARWLAAPVSDLKALPFSFNSIKLTWAASTGANEYEIYRADSSGGTYSLFATATTNSITDSNLVTGTTYYYKIRANALTGEARVSGDFSPVVSAKPATPTPTNLTAAPASYNSIKLTWTEVNGANGYAIYRATSSAGTYSLIKTTTTATASFTNTYLTTGKTYYYKIKAYSLVGTTKKYGSLTAAVNAKPIPAVPASFTAARYSSTSIRLSWAPVSGASGYAVYRSASSNGTYSMISRVVATAYRNSGLTTGKTYYYKVRAYRLVGTTRVYGNYTAVKYAKP